MATGCRRPDGWSGARVRSWEIGSKTEGCVADDANGWLFVGEEEVGIWRYDAEPDAGTTERFEVDRVGVGEAGGGRLAASVGRRDPVCAVGRRSARWFPDRVQSGQQHLRPSTTGRRRTRIAERSAWATAPRSTGTEDTDGVDVAPAPLGPSYPMGLLVVQDGINVAADGSEANQNFKFVSWRDVAEALNLIPG